MTDIVKPTKESLNQFSDLLDIDELLQDPVENSLAWFLANGWDYDTAKLYAEVIDNSNSVDEFWNDKTINYDALPDQEKDKLNRVFENIYLM